MTDLRLLVIEDSDDDAELMLAELARCGYRCHATRAATREGVRHALETAAFDMVISDYRIPQFSGAAALELVRAHDGRLPFIVVSGTIGEELAVDLIRSGASDYVMKGNLARLGVAVARELAAARVSRENASLALALERTREQLGETVALAPVGIAHTCLSGRWLMVNDALCGILGYSADELRGKTFVEITHPDDVAKSMAGHDALIRADGPPFRTEKRYIRKDGSIVWASIAATAVRDAGGGVDYFVTVISDITERRRTQEELRRRALQQQAIALFGQMALAGCSREMLLEELTGRLLSLTGADAADVFESVPAGKARLVAGAGWPSGMVVPAMEEGSGSHVGYALATGVTVSVASLSGEQPFRVPAMLEEAGIRSVLVVPIGGGADGLFGTIGVYSRTSGQFGAEDEAFLRACTHVVAEAVQRQKNETVLEVTARQQSALAEIAGRFLREPVDQPIRACDAVASALEADYAAYLEIDPSGEFAVVVDGATWLGGPGARVPLKNTQAAYTIATAGPVVIADFETESRFAGRPYFEDYGLRSGISVPVRGHAGILGVIKVATRARREFNADAVQFLQALADLVAEGLERRRIHRELAASRERYRNVFEGAAEVMISVTPGGRILALNHAFEQRTGWPVGQWLGHDFLELIAEQDRDASLKYFADALVEGRGSARTSILTADGGTRDLEWSWVVVRTDGRVDEIFGFGRDVTERLRIEHARARLADELALILDSVAEGIYRFDADGACSMINRAAVDMLGGERQAYVGARLAPLDPSGADAGEAMPRLLELVSSRRSVHVTEGTFVTGTGRVLPVEFSVAPLVRNDMVLGGVVCFWDISRRRQLETQLEQERRLSSLGKLAASVAHEFNNVMMGIAPFAEIISRTAPRDLARASQHITEAVRRGKRITEEILRFANPAPPAAAPLDAVQWLATIEPEMRTVLTALHSLHLEAEPGLAMLADATQLNQVVLNLTVNARDAMPDRGSLFVSVRVADPAVAQSFALPREAAYVHISVRDTGTGIASENVAHIFEPLFTTKRSGTGLGLPISRQIIKRHGGEMFVETVPGQGTTFHLFLPRTTQPAPNVVAGGGKLVPPLRTSARLLLVEDDTHVAAGLLLALSEAGMNVQHVATGEAAVAALSSGNVDAAILDIGLPDMEGTRVYERAGRSARIPVVFSTGHADEAKVAPYLGEAHVAYLLKPYRIDTLLETLAAVIPPG